MVNRYFTIINIFLITVGVFLSVNAFYTLITARFDYAAPSAGPAGKVSSSAQPRSQPPLSEYRAILERNIFNSNTETTAAATRTVDIEKLKETELKLKLWGTVTGQTGRAYAVIEDTKSKEQNLYHAGDSVQNAIVKLILREKVVLRVDDRDEILTMEEIQGAKSGSRAGQTGTYSSAQAPADRLPVSSYPRKISVKGEQIEKAMENLGQLMEQATLRPHIEDGQTAGISITGIKPNAIFRRMRLRNGDIITGVNGNSISSVEDAVKVFEDLSSGSNIQIQIKRRGREQTLDYRIE